MPPKNHMKRVQTTKSHRKKIPQNMQTKQPTATSLPEPLTPHNTASAPVELRQASETVASTDRENIGDTTQTSSNIVIQMLLKSYMH